MTFSFLGVLTRGAGVFLAALALLQIGLISLYAQESPTVEAGALFVRQGAMAPAMLDLSPLASSTRWQLQVWSVDSQSKSEVCHGAGMGVWHMVPAGGHTPMAGHEGEFTHELKASESCPAGLYEWRLYWMVQTAPGRFQIQSTESDRWEIVPRVLAQAESLTAEISADRTTVIEEGMVELTGSASGVPSRLLLSVDRDLYEIDDPSTYRDLRTGDREVRFTTDCRFRALASYLSRLYGGASETVSCIGLFLLDLGGTVTDLDQVANQHNIEGLAEHDGKLFALAGASISPNSRNIYEVDLGGVTTSASRGTVSPGLGAPLDIADHGGQMYAIDDSGDELWTVDVTTPGGTGTAEVGDFPAGVDFSRFQDSGLTSHAGSMYIIEGNARDLWSFDPVNPGGATLEGNNTHIANSSDRLGLASHPQTVTYAWSSTAGSFSSTTTATSTWTGPAVTTHGATIEETVTLVVTAGGVSSTTTITIMVRDTVLPDVDDLTILSGGWLTDRPGLAITAQSGGTEPEAGIRLRMMPTPSALLLDRVQYEIRWQIELFGIAEDDSPRSTIHSAEITSGTYSLSCGGSNFIVAGDVSACPGEGERDSFLNAHKARFTPQLVDTRDQRVRTSARSVTLIRSPGEPSIGDEEVWTRVPPEVNGTVEGAVLSVFVEHPPGPVYTQVLINDELPIVRYDVPEPDVATSSPAGHNVKVYLTSDQADAKWVTFAVRGVTYAAGSDYMIPVEDQDTDALIPDGSWAYTAWTREISLPLEAVAGEADVPATLQTPVAADPRFTRAVEDVIRGVMYVSGDESARDPSVTIPEDDVNRALAAAVASIAILGGAGIGVATRVATGFTLEGVAAGTFFAAGMWAAFGYLAAGIPLQLAVTPLLIPFFAFVLVMARRSS